MLTYQAFYQTELKKLINAKIIDLQEMISLGAGTPDFPTYKQQIGKIEGLRIALELCEEAEAITNGGDRN